MPDLKERNWLLCVGRTAVLLAVSSITSASSSRSATSLLKRWGTKVGVSRPNLVVTEPLRLPLRSWMLCRREKCAAALLVSFLGFFLAPRRVDEFDVRQTSLTKLDACTKAPKEGDDQRACDNTFSENFSSSKTMSVPSKIQKRERARREEEEREQVVRDVAQEPRSLAIEQRIDVQPYRLLPPP